LLPGGENRVQRGDDRWVNAARHHDLIGVDLHAVAALVPSGDQLRERARQVEVTPVLVPHPLPAAPCVIAGAVLKSMSAMPIPTTMLPLPYSLICLSNLTQSVPKRSSGVSKS
jgi:hypothetical protein